MSDHTDMRDTLLEQIDARHVWMGRYRAHWDGRPAPAYLSKPARQAVNNRVAKLYANFPRLTVTSLVERLRLAGFERDGESDPELRRRWRELNLHALGDLVHTDRALYGNAYVCVWGREDDPRPLVTADSPANMTVSRDTGTGDMAAALRTWEQPDPRTGAAGTRHLLMFTPDRVTKWEAPAGTYGWRTVSDEDNPLGTVPVVPFTREASIGDTEGTSAVEDIIDLTDAIAKVLGDAMVTSESYARPRRWATGLEIMEDENGDPVDPFGESRFLQNENDAGRFGQLEPASLDGYSNLLASLTQQIGALTGLPGHYLGLAGEQPPNADSVRAAESQLTSRARTEIRQLTQPWARVAALTETVATGAPTEPADITPRWESPELRTPGQAADAAAKLAEIGLPLDTIMADTLGMDPGEIERVRKSRRRKAIDESVPTVDNRPGRNAGRNGDQAPADGEVAR